MFRIEKESFIYGDKEVTLETGEFARQATAAVMASMGDTAVLCTVVAAKEARAGQDFFPLTVDYMEKTYAAGKIPGGFFKREGRPSEKETLTCRLIDRPIRPLFPEGFLNEVQVVCTVVSLDPECDPDIVAMIGVSAALALSGIPFNGPIGAARVGYIDGQYKLNPLVSELEDSLLDLVVAGTESAVLMVESEAKQLTEEQMLGAVVFGHEQMQTAIDAICKLVERAGKEEWSWTPQKVNESLQKRVQDFASGPLEEAYKSRNKQERSGKIKQVYADTIEKIGVSDSGEGDEGTFDGSLIGNIYSGTGFLC